MNRHFSWTGLIAVTAAIVMTTATYGGGTSLASSSSGPAARTAAGDILGPSHAATGKPLVFGKDRNKGIRLNGLDPEVVTLGNGITVDDLLIHDERAEEPSLAYLLSRMVYPRFPECIGVFRCVERPTYDDLVTKQIEDVQRAKGRAKLEDLFASDDTWVVE